MTQHPQSRAPATAGRVARCPGLPGDPEPCGRALLPTDLVGLCMECELRADHTHGVDLIRASWEADHDPPRRPRMMVLDLFCGAGGAAQGYIDAGFDVVGWDIKRRRCGYPGEFHHGDVLDVLTDLDYLRSFDLIHASPPCQTHSRTQHLRDAQGKGTDKVDLIPQTRNALANAGVPYVIENVPGAPLRQDLLLCGSMFPHLYTYDQTGRRWLQRHRVFEIGNWRSPFASGSRWIVPQPPCDHKGAGVRPLGVYGSTGDNIPSGGQTARTLAEASNLMGIHWMSWSALVEAIPPAYTEHIGTALSRANHDAPG